MKWIFKIRLFSLNIGKYRFSPDLIMTILAITLAYTSFTQQRVHSTSAQYKDNQQQKIVERQNMPAIGYNQLPHEPEDRFFLPVKFQGSFDADH